MKSLYIFDLDGTLAHIEHRRHYVEGEKKNWKKFFAACVDDIPNIPVIKIFKALRENQADLWIWSGRSDEVFHETVTWLEKYGINYDQLRMRHKGDYTPDDKLKESWLLNSSFDDLNRLQACFDDRDRIVQMYRRNGVTCLQVADGNF